MGEEPSGPFRDYVKIGAAPRLERSDNRDEIMMQRIRLLTLGIALLAVATSVPLEAANKEHQQMMADLRILQQQTQLLQAHLTALTEALKTVTTRLDEQAGVNRKAFADQKLLVDGVATDLRVVREKVDETNVRLGSLSQEVDAVRVAQSSMPTAAAAGDSAAAAQNPTTPPAAPPTMGNLGVSPKVLFDSAPSRLLRGTVEPRDWGIRVLSQDVSKERSRRRCAVLHR